MMKIHALMLVVGTLLACQVQAQITTPTIDSPLRPGSEVTLASVNEPETGEGTTPDGVSADQVFTGAADQSQLGTDLQPLSVGADNNEPVLSGPVISGRKLRSGRKMLDSTLLLNGDGVSAGEGGNGVTTTLAGHGQSGALQGQATDTHIEPHSDTTTLTADGQSVTEPVAVNPDNLLAGEGQPTVVAGGD